MTTEKQYRDLAPDEVLRPGDKWVDIDGNLHDTKCVGMTVEQARAPFHKTKYRRPIAEANETKCPKCGGEADNGFDRCYPPNPYYCTKCEANETKGSAV